MIISCDGPLCCLSNYSTYPFIINNVRYISVIQAYYVYLAKNDRLLVAELMKAKTDNDILMIEHRNGIFSRAGIIDIHRKRYDYLATKQYLYKVLRAKLEQNYLVKAVLFATKNEDIFIRNGNDRIIGIGNDGFGLNLCGVILMELREHLNGRPRTTKIQSLYDSILKRIR